MKISALLGDSCYFFYSNLQQIILLCLPWLLISSAMEQSFLSLYTEPLGKSTAEFIAYLIQLPIYPIFGGAFILLMAKRSMGEYPSNSSLVRASLKLWYPLFLITVFTNCMFQAGMIVFILLGLWVLVKLSFCEFYLVILGKKPIESIQLSYMATNKNFWVILLCIISIFIPITIIGTMLGNLLKETDQAFLLAVILHTIISFCYLFMTTVLFRIFMLSELKNQA